MNTFLIRLSQSLSARVNLNGLQLRTRARSSEDRLTSLKSNEALLSRPLWLRNFRPHRLTPNRVKLILIGQKTLGHRNSRVLISTLHKVMPTSQSIHSICWNASLGPTPTST